MNPGYPGWFGGQPPQKPPKHATFAEKLELFMNSRPIWDGQLDVAGAPLPVGFVQIPQEMLVTVVGLPLPVTCNLWLETNPKSLGENIPGNTPAPFVATWGSDRVKTTKSLYNGCYTIHGSSFEVYTQAKNILENVWLRASLALAFSPLNQNFAAGL